MKLYEASHQKEKLVLNESLFEATEDITELVRKSTEAYKELKKYRKNNQRNELKKTPIRAFFMSEQQNLPFYLAQQLFL